LKKYLLFCIFYLLFRKIGVSLCYYLIKQRSDAQIFFTTIQYIMESKESPIQTLKVTLRFLSHKYTRNVIDLLQSKKLDEQGLSVTEVYKSLDIEQSVASNTLIKLKAFGFAESKRDAKKMRYRLTDRYGEFLKQIAAIQVGS
jgi:DNA-binding transcriptional ArsR family regulator